MRKRWIGTSAMAVVCAAVLASVPASASAAWTKEATVNPSSVANELEEVSCWSAGKCVAVGMYENSKNEPEPLVERLSGGTWTKETAPLPAAAVEGGYFNGVSCPTSEFCVASGVYHNSGGESTAFEDEYTTVGKWKELAVSLPGTALQSQFDRVSCVVEKCMAVGVYEVVGSKLLPFAEHWTSAHGSSLEYPPGAAEGVLLGVSCVDSEECMAVGWTNKVVLSDEWTGGTWTRTTSASSSYSPVKLEGVDCLGPELNCTGVGWGTSSGTELTMSEEFTKTGGWLAASTKNPSATKDTLTAVGCWEKSKCMGVGEEGKSPTQAALIEKLEGSSSAVETPATLTGAENSRLLGISCLQQNTSDCMAVGWYATSSEGIRTIAESN
jgi:hypothetical protein